MRSQIRVLALMEGDSVTGPAKNLIQIGTHGRDVAGSTSLDITVATFGRGGRTAEPLVDALRLAGLRSGVLMERQRFDTAVISQLREMVERYRPDIIQTHMVKSHFLLRYSGLWRSHRWLAFHHGYTRVDRKMMVYNQVDRWSLRKAHAIVTVCRPFVEQLTDFGIPASRITVQHNSVPAFEAPEHSVTARLRSRLGIPDRIPVLLTVGRLSAEKGFDDLVEAAAIARSSSPDFRLVIVGEGPERQRLESSVARLGLTGRVLLPGHNNCIAPWYAMADFLVMPSHSEGSPNVLLEAMAAGLPIIATTVGGIPEIATDGETALLIPPHRPPAIANAITALLNDAALANKLSVQARLHAESRFSISSHYRSLIHVYERLTGMASRAGNIAQEFGCPGSP
jgi:glycosyltransferase involved in cell wall biosynthesis